MIRYLTAVKNLFSKTHKIEDVEPEQELPDSYIAKDECSASIEFRLDRFTGDFNILVEVNQRDEDTSETLGLLLHLINTGNLKGFFTEGEASGVWEVQYNKKKYTGTLEEVKKKVPKLNEYKF